MIIDQFGVFFDDTPAAASMTSKTINFMPYAGREDSIMVSLLAKGANAAAVTFTVKMQQSKDNVAFTDVETIVVAKPDVFPVMTAMRLPVQAKDQFVRIAVTVVGAVAGITLFAALTRDHFAPYDKGLYIDGGKVVA